MKFKLNNNLFWFFKRDAGLDLATPAGRDAYVQQAATHGNAEEVKKLIKTLFPFRLKESIGRLKRFLPLEVRLFWEDFIGSPNFTAKSNP